eukprot:scaffold47974_cov32-Cyclotella_meneghiniana.AAC.1
MSSRRPSKAYVMPGRVLGFTPETACASPQRKSRVNSKRSAGVEVQRSILRPSAPAFKPASSIPAAPAPPLAPGAIEAAKKAAKKGSFRHTSTMTMKMKSLSEGYSERSILTILAGCSESYRLGARDAKWDPETRAITPLTQLGRSDFTAKMAARNMTVLLPDLMKCYSKQDSTKRTFSDATKEEVAKGLRFKDKPGYNPTSADAASVLTDRSQATSGAASNRSVTTHDIQCQLPELRTELNRLRQKLLELSPDDNLFDHPLMASSTVDDLSEHSSASE